MILRKNFKNPNPVSLKTLVTNNLISRRTDNLSNGNLIALESALKHSSYRAINLELTIQFFVLAWNDSCNISQG